MKSNRPALSILKTNFVLSHSKRLKPYKSLNLKTDGVNIQEVSTVKYLGVTFDSNLTFKNHVNELCLKLSKTVGIFSKLRYYVNVDTLIMLYYSLINHNYNKIVKSDWLSTALISALIGQLIGQYALSRARLNGFFFFHC